MTPKTDCRTTTRHIADGSAASGVAFYGALEVRNGQWWPVVAIDQVLWAFTSPNPVHPWRRCWESNIFLVQQPAGPAEPAGYTRPINSENQWKIPCFHISQIGMTVGLPAKSPRAPRNKNWQDACHATVPVPHATRFHAVRLPKGQWNHGQGVFQD
eukprot:s3189_g3.t1